MILYKAQGAAHSLIHFPLSGNTQTVLSIVQNFYGLKEKKKKKVVVRKRENKWDKCLPARVTIVSLHPSADERRRVLYFIAYANCCYVR